MKYLPMNESCIIIKYVWLSLGRITMSSTGMDDGECRYVKCNNCNICGQTVIDQTIHISKVHK